MLNPLIPQLWDLFARAQVFRMQKLRFPTLLQVSSLVPAPWATHLFRTEVGFTVNVVLRFNVLLWLKELVGEEESLFSIGWPLPSFVLPLFRALMLCTFTWA